MSDAIISALQSRTGRTTGLILGAALFTFLAGYIVFGPIALSLVSR